MKKIKKLGITGIFGSGKTTVAEIFKKYGFSVISCDEIVHQLLKKEEIKKKLAEVFGEEIIKNGKVDRKKLAEIVFVNETKRKALEQILHPLVFEIIEKMISENIDTLKKKGIIVIEIPLLFETNAEKDFDYILVVKSSPDVIMQRLRKKFTPKEIELRWKNQLPLSYKEKRADFVIDNSENYEHTEQQVKQIINKIKSNDR